MSKNGWPSRAYPGVEPNSDRAVANVQNEHVGILCVPYYRITSAYIRIITICWMHTANTSRRFLEVESVGLRIFTLIVRNQAMESMIPRETWSSHLAPALLVELCKRGFSFCPFTSYETWTRYINSYSRERKTLYTNLIGWMNQP